jgi:RNA polymerase sigma-70 factor (ECF subfamily)
MAVAAQTMVMMSSGKGKERQDGVNGDGAAVDRASGFSRIYRRHFRPLYSFIAFRVRNREAAEDITSQVFEKALAAWDGYDPGRSSHGTWLFTIARNCLSDHFRRLGRRGRTDLLDERSAASSLGNPESELFAGERQRQLAAALSALDERGQELVALKFGAGLSNREIAALMDISESNAGTILYRSLAKLKKELEGGIDDD